jgi:hypothetical protein
MREIFRKMKLLILGILAAFGIVLAKASSAGAAELGRLTINSTPRGSIKINGVDQGNSPATFELAPGSYQVVISQTGYDDYTENSTVISRAETTVNATLILSTGSLIINSTPSGASIKINGNTQGTTPKSFELAPGSYQVVISLTGYQNYTQTLSVTSDTERTINAALTPANGTLAISSSPTGASIKINGENQGTTPGRFTLAPGSYQVVISKSGYDDYNDTASVVSDTVNLLSVTLNARNGSLTINSTPSGASIKINETLLEYTTPNTVNLIPGTYQIIIHKAYYYDYSTTETIAPGGSATINASLVAKPIPTVLLHPEEPMNPAQTKENTPLADVVTKWLTDWGIPVAEWDWWRTQVSVNVYNEWPQEFLDRWPSDINVNTPAFTYDGSLYILAKWLNAGVIAHEESHISYSLLTAAQKTSFNNTFNALEYTNSQLVLLWSINGYGHTRNPAGEAVEGHAEILRYWGLDMPEVFSGYYPRLV